MDLRRQPNQKQTMESIRKEAELMTTEIHDQELEQEDRISKLPDDMLINILDRLELLCDAVRTSVLSKRWRHVPGLLSEIVLDVAHFESEETGSNYTLNELAQANASVVEATRSILAHKSQRTIDYLSIKFYLRDESIHIVQYVDNAMANREVISAEFIIITEMPDICYSPGDRVINGKRLMAFLDAYPRAFNGLTDLCLYSLSLSKFDISNVLMACKKLEHLSLNSCDAGIGSVLQIEHPQLYELSIIHCPCKRIDLYRLPRLTRLTCQTWIPSHDTYPLTFGYVPQLSVLSLSNMASIHHNNLKLSQLLLRNVDIANLDLNFQCQKIWIEPEAPRPLALLRNLKMIRLRFVHEKCDLSWTMFFLEAAPLLKEINVQVLDHVCLSGKGMTRHHAQMQLEVFKKESDHLKWESHNDFKHYNLSKLTIEGFEVKEKYRRYIRQVMKAAVNLKVVLLRKSRLCGSCRVCPSMAYPGTEEQDHIRIRISDQRSSPVRIVFDP